MINKRMMKKCGTILLLLTAVLCSCNPKGVDNSKNATPGNNNVTDASGDIAAETSPAEIIGFCDTIPIDSYAPNSPSMKINVALEPLTLDNSTATARAISSISYAMSGVESDNLSDAIEIYRNKLVSRYEELRSDYINIRANNEEPFWLNHHYNVKGVCRKGYRGYNNYILEYDEYEGGAHGYYYTAVHTFDPTDGHEVTLDEIMKEGYEEELLDAIAAGLIRYSKANGITELDRLQSDTGELFISKNAVLNDSCITFIYNPYEIASYATGRIEVDITYEELKHILK